MTGKYEPILIIFSLLHSTMKCRMSYYFIIHHLTSNLLPHYLANFECSTTGLHVFLVQKFDMSFIYSKYIYRNVSFWITCLCQLIYNITACGQNICHEHARILCVVHATLSMVASMTRCCNALPGAVAICCADVMSNDAVGTRKRQLCSNKSIRQKYLLVYHSKTKLLSDLLIILVNINE